MKFISFPIFRLILYLDNVKFGRNPVRGELVEPRTIHPSTSSGRTENQKFNIVELYKVNFE